MQRVDGYVATFVSGVPVFEHGVHTGALPGIGSGQLQTAAAVIVATVSSAFVLAILARVQAGF